MHGSTRKRDYRILFLCNKCETILPLKQEPTQTANHDNKTITLEWKFIKGCRMGRSDKVSLWYVSLLINTRFRFLILEYAIVKRIWCYIKTKNFQMTQGGYQVITVLPIKSKMAAAKKRCFLRFLYFTESSLPSFKVQGLQMTMNLALV